MNQRSLSTRRALGAGLVALCLFPAAALAQQNTAQTIQSVVAVTAGGTGSAGCGGGNGANLSSILNAALPGPDFSDNGVGIEGRRLAYRFCDSLTGAGGGGWTGSNAVTQSQYDTQTISLAPEEVFAQMDNANSAFDLQTGNVSRRLSLVRLARRDARRRNTEIARRNTLSQPRSEDETGFARLSREDEGQQILLALQDGVNAGDGTEGSGLGFFINGRVNAIKGESNASERGSDGFGGGFTLGVDQALGDDFFGGIAMGYTHIDTRYDGSSSESELDAVTITGYGAFYPTENLYIDGSVAISYLGFESSNELLLLDGGPDAGTLDGEANGVNFGFDLGVGHAFDVAELIDNKSVEGLVFEPTARLNFLYTYIEDYDQDGADGSLDLSIDEQETISVTASLGFRTEYPISTRNGVLTPYVRAAYVHEFNNENDDIEIGLAAIGGGSIRLKAEATDSHYANIGAGVAATLGQGLSQFIDYDVIAGHENVTIHQVTAGMRFEF